MINGVFVGFQNGMRKKDLEELKKKIESVVGYGAEILEMDRATHVAILVNDEVKD